MRTTLFLFLLSATAVIFNGCKDKNAQQPGSTIDMTKYVNVFIGTGGHGHTYPGATTPFGLVQLSPDLGTEGWDWCSGYHYSDSSIIGFSHTHLSGTGCGDLGDILIMPFLGKVTYQSGTKDKPDDGYRSRFSHKDEIAEPGYYSVVLKDDNIKAELTATSDVGFHQYTFPASDSVNFVFDLFSSIHNRYIAESEVTIENDSTVSGYRAVSGWAPLRYVYFVARFSKPFFEPLFFWGNNEQVWKNISSRKNQGPQKCFIKMKTKHNEVVKIKVGISSVNKEGAFKVIEQETPDWNFILVKERTKELWNKELNKIKVDGTNKQKQIFYTALYHTLVVPNQIADYEGNYIGPDGKVHQSKTGKYYSTFSLWDTYRAANPLYTLIEEDKVNGFINSMLENYKYNGYLPMWTLWGSETNCMIGNHAIPVIVDAYLKGIKGFDAEQAYTAIKESSMKDHFHSSWSIYTKLGYIPYDHEEQSVSKTLEMCYNDWCVAQMAKAMNKNEDYEYFSKRALNYKKLFDKSVGFMRGKDSKGNFKTPFDPYSMDWSSYTEGTAFQYSWYVPHDVPGLIDLFGGKVPFEKRLDSLFTSNEPIKGQGLDVTGLIGQYAHGNEPSHHIAYLYNYADKPWKTQKTIHEIFSTQYNNTVDGYSGNEDCGQMSAWFVLSSMGFYAVNPASGRYDFGTPLLAKAEINLYNGKKFIMTAHQLSDKNIFIASIKLNGNPYNKGYITHADILNGATLEFFMSDKPNESLKYIY